MLRQARRDFRATRAQIFLCDARRIGEEILGGPGFQLFGKSPIGGQPVDRHLAFRVFHQLRFAVLDG